MAQTTRIIRPPRTDIPPTLLTLKDFARLLQKAPSTIYRNWHAWVNDGRIKVLYICGQPRFRAEDLPQFLKSFEVDRRGKRSRDAS